MLKNFLLAPDSFKGTIDADEVCAIWKCVILEHIPDANIVSIPVSDGGEGLADSYLKALPGQAMYADVTGPNHLPVTAKYAVMDGGGIVMDMASCAGLPLMGRAPDPLNATTMGVGELLATAAKQGKNIVMGIGGSATNDCGLGCAHALGYRFLDSAGTELEPSAANMIKVAKIVKPQRDMLDGANITIACDVDNPLHGPDGAAYTFGRQKGADDKQLALIDAGLKNMAAVIKRDLGADIAQMPGAGAAGGLGAGMAAFFGAVLRPGVEMFLDAAGIDEKLKNTDIVFTGEGRMDGPSVRGKAPVGVGRRAKRAGVPCIALCGALGEGYASVYSHGITAAFSSINRTADFDGIAATAKKDARMLVDSVMRTLLAIL